MKKYYAAYVYIDRYQDWECYGVFCSGIEALNMCQEIMLCDEDARDYEVRAISEGDAVKYKYDIDNLAGFKEDYADSMDQSCPSEIHAHGFPADDPEAKREYEAAAKDFCMDNLGCFDK